MVPIYCLFLESTFSGKIETHLDTSGRTRSNNIITPILFQPLYTKQLSLSFSLLDHRHPYFDRTTSSLLSTFLRKYRPQALLLARHTYTLELSEKLQRRRDRCVEGVRFVRARATMGSRSRRSRCCFCYISDAPRAIFSRCREGRGSYRGYWFGERG